MKEKKLHMYTMYIQTFRQALTQKSQTKKKKNRCVNRVNGIDKLKNNNNKKEVVDFFSACIDYVKNDTL